MSRISIARKLSVLGLLLSCAVQLSAAPAEKPQPKVQITTMKGEAFIVPECECLIMPEDSALSVIAVLEPSKRPEKYRTIDLQKGDKVLMVNGKRMKTPGEFETLYGTMKIGDILQIALKRDGKPVMVSYAKGEPIPGATLKTVTMNGDGTQTTEENGAHRMVKKLGDGENYDDIDALAPLGVVLGFKNKKATVIDLLPIVDGMYDKDHPESKDVLVSIDGVEVSGLDGIDAIRPKLIANKKGTIVVMRGGKELTCSYTVPAELPHLMIKH